MIGWFLFGLMTAAPLSAELAFSVVREGIETPLSSQVQLRQAAAGDTLDTLFRIRNIGQSNASVTTITIAGAGLSVTSLPALPATVPPDASVDFVVRFQPPLPATYSAVLKTDRLSVFVLATGVPSAKVYVEENGSRRPLDTATGLDFGAVERGASQTRRVVLLNEIGQPLTSALGTAGSAFQLVAGGGVITLDPASSAFIDVVYAPVSPGPQVGELRIDTRRFPLRGTTVEPPLPKPIVTLDFNGAAPASGSQPVASVRFDPVPRTSGSGRLRLDFHPSVTDADDAAILFLTTASRSIDFSVIEGVANTQFGPAIAIPLQTGTTAGTIVLTAELGDYAETARVEIPPQPVVIDAVEMTRTASGIEVQVRGYDNTRSLSAASFTFLQKDGAPLAPGTIQQDLATLFKDYFAHSGVGGSFQLKLTFPVTGGTATIDSLRLVVTNAAGHTSWQAAP